MSSGLFSEKAVTRSQSRAAAAGTAGQHNTRATTAAAVVSDENV